MGIFSTSCTIHILLCFVLVMLRPIMLTSCRVISLALQQSYNCTNDNEAFLNRQQAINWTNDGWITDAYMCHSTSMN